uniref:G_PROTEIN_RECEP_F3_4 domain-containing protein n=1 Tax=Macrostomum lignano TaxID=282301 RepID=A0A1I8JPD4_9PLAT
IPQISYASTSPELSDNNRFDYFFRVVPPDNYQAKAMVAIVRSMGWNYVTAIYDEGTYGERGFQEFKSHASQQGEGDELSAFASASTSTSSFSKRSKRQPRGIADGLLKLEKSRVVVAFCQAETLRLLFGQGSRLTKRSFFWVASDGLGTKDRTPAGGAVPGRGGHQPAAGEAGLWQVNPWWPEFWESHFHCSWDGRPGSAEQIGMHSRYEQEGLVPMVVDAVYAMAHSLENMLHRLCPKAERDVLRDHIRNATGESLYEIFQFQRRPAGKNASSVFEYVKIGTWGDDHLENWTTAAFRWGTPDEVAPRSVCSEPCGFGYRTVAPNKEAATCCWECVPCDNKYQIVLNATLCSNCELGSVPNRFFNECQPLPVETIQLGSVWALLPMTFSFLGLVWTVFVLARELCYVMLAGVSMSYCMTFIMLAPPTPVTCGFLRIFNGLSLSIIYSAIFTKTNRLSRIFNRGIKSPKSQLILCCCLVSVQVIGDMTWLGMDLPKTKFDYPDRDHKVLRCAVDDVAIVVSLLLTILILIVLCTLYAFKTRNIPENFNEAKYIAFTMYSTCIVWLAFIAIYFGSLRNFRHQRLGHCWLHVRFPKIYIVLFKPHKNGRDRTPHRQLAAAAPAAQGRRELFSPTKKPCCWAVEFGVAAKRPANIDTARAERSLPNASALPADGGVASDSDSDSGGGRRRGGNIKGPGFRRETSTAVESDLLFSRVTWFIDEEATFAMPAASFFWCSGL